MKKIFCLTLPIIFILFIAVILNINVTTKQCIDYNCHTSNIPIYLKLLDFFDRHYNYALLVKNIIKDAKSDEERVLKILGWTYGNIKRVPNSFPVIDDHVWHIIVRGYGTDDQFQDVFTTLCNFAHLDAFFGLLQQGEIGPKKTFSFVRFKKDWSVFDAYYGVYFKNKGGKIAALDDIHSGNWQVCYLTKNEEISYHGFFENIGKINFENWKFSRPAIQSPFRRIIFGTKKGK